MTERTSTSTSARTGRRTFLPAFLFSAAVLILFLLFFSPWFETGDDPTFIRMVDGAKGTTDPHLVYQNILLGFLYKALYLLPVRLPWYSIFQYGLILLTLTALCAGIRRLLPDLTGWIWCAFLSLFLGWECYVRIQYTKTAGAAACAGVFLILLAIGGGKKDERRQKIDPFIPCGILLAFAGFLMRMQQALVCTVLMSGGGLLLLLKEKTASERLAILRKAAISLGILLALAGVCHLADRASYRSGPLEGFLEFDQARIDLLDYELPDFEENKDALEALGIDRSAYFLLKAWAYADPEVFTTQTLKAMAAMRPAKKLIDKAQLRTFFTEVPKGMLARRFFYLALAGLLFWILLGRRRLPNILSCVYELLLFSGLYYYLIHTGRYLVNRVDVPLLLAVFLVFFLISCDGGMTAAIPSMSGKAKTFRPIVTGVICIGCTALMFLSQGPSFETLLKGSTRAGTLQQYSDRARELIGQAAADPDHLYLAKLYTLSDDYAYGVFDTAPKGSLSNILWLGGWSTYTVCYRNIMEKYGITNPMKDMINNPDVYLIDNKLKRTLKYLKSHYDMDVKAKNVGTIGNFEVNAIISD